MKTEKFPITVTVGGVSAKIRKVTQRKGGKAYIIYIIDYTLFGRRRQEGRASLDDAREVAANACRQISNGDQASLELKHGDRLAYARSIEALAPTGVPIDTACREYAAALQILGGKASIIEACRDWVKRNENPITAVAVAEAVRQLIQQAGADGKSALRIKQLENVLNRFAESFQIPLGGVTPALMSQYLARLPLSERSRRNHRDVLGFFNRFCVLRGYLAKGTDWLEGVQNYTARKLGAIEIYTPEEIRGLLSKADSRLVPFLAIGAFAGLRHAEISRLDWSEVELADKDGESFIEIRAEKSKTQTRRLVPVKANLKAWLFPHRKPTGKVCPYANITKQLLRLAATAGIGWKKNALRHSCISYRVAECGDVPRVSDESGNSVQVIRSNYLRRVKPAVATDWFSTLPPRKVTTRKTTPPRTPETLPDGHRTGLGGVRTPDHSPDVSTTPPGTGKGAN